MINILNMSELKQGMKAFVSDINLNNNMRRRLQDLGLIKGTEIKCIKKSPLGDPIAFLVRGTVIALRYEDSSHIKIQCGEV